MNHRFATMLGPEPATTATTKTLDINVSDPISRITVQFKGTNNGSAPTAHPAKMVSKIEVVDGSDVLFGLSGVEAQALNYYEKGRMPHNVCNYIDEAKAIATYEINFGRFLWDTLLALDPKKFTNPQLKITHNKANGGSSPDVGELAVFAHIFDEKTVSPTGFLMSKEQYSYTLQAGANEPIDIATDFPYRKLLIQSMSTSLQPWEQYNQLKLSQDNDRKVIINDEKVSDLFKLMQTHPPIVETIHIYGALAAAAVHCTPSYERMASIATTVADATKIIGDTYGGAFTVTIAAATIGMMLASGLAPHGAFCIPFGIQDEIEDWFNVADIGSLMLVLKAGGSASGTCEIIAQQLRNY